MEKVCDEHRSIGFELKVVSNLIRRKLQSGFLEDGLEELAGIQGPVLGFLARTEKERDVFQKDIEQEFNIRRSTATVLLQNLEQNGYVIREPVQHDARLKKITLTEKAVRQCEIIFRRIEEFNTQLEEGITKEERAVLFRVLYKIEHNLEK